MFDDIFCLPIDMWLFQLNDWFIITPRNLVEVSWLIAMFVKSVNLKFGKITDWFKANKLSLNIKNTYFILFRTKNKKIVSNVSVKIDNIAINQDTSTKFLGIIILFCICIANTFTVKCISLYTESISCLLKTNI